MSEEPRRSGPTHQPRKGHSTPKQGERKADMSTNSDTEQDLNDNENDNGGLMNFIFGGKKDQRKTNGLSSSAPPNIVQLPQVPDTMRQTDLPTDRERIETEIIKSLIESYFKIVRKNFTDLVPKTIMYFLVNHARDSMQNELVSELYRENNIAELMREADDVALRRNTCMEMRDLLRKALEIVNEVRDFNTFK
uniref:GED domain-containing protein n=1 Tax=Leptocylindrus danicus TaxID=163516 RepID=A0A7S2NRY4_9STRA